MSFVLFVTYIPSTVLIAISDNLEMEFDNISLDNDNIDEVCLESNSHKERYIDREMMEKRTVDSKYFLLEDGTLMQQKFSIPVHYRDEDEYKEQH